MEHSTKYALHLTEQLAAQFQCESYSDIALLADGDARPIYAARNVLATNSYFHAMLGGSFAETQQSTLTMKEIGRETLVACVQFIYSGSITLNKTNVLPVLAAADMYNIIGLVTICCEQMCTLVDQQCWITYLLHIQALTHIDTANVRAACLACVSSWPQFDSASWEGVESLDLVSIQYICEAIGVAANTADPVPWLDRTLDALVRWGVARGVAPTALALCEFVHAERLHRHLPKLQFEFDMAQKGPEWSQPFRVMGGLDARIFFDGKMAELELTVANSPNWWIEYIACSATPVGHPHGGVWTVCKNCRFVVARESVPTQTAQKFVFAVAVSHNPLRSICRAFETHHPELWTDNFLAQWETRFCLRYESLIPAVREDHIFNAILRIGRLHKSERTNPLDLMLRNVRWKFVNPALLFEACRTNTLIQRSPVMGGVLDWLLEPKSRGRPNWTSKQRRTPEDVAYTHSHAQLRSSLRQWLMSGK